MIIFEIPSASFASSSSSVFALSARAFSSPLPSSSAKVRHSWSFEIRGPGCTVPHELHVFWSSKSVELHFLEVRPSAPKMRPQHTRRGAGAL